MFFPSEWKKCPNARIKTIIPHIMYVHPRHGPTFIKAPPKDIMFPYLLALRSSLVSSGSMGEGLSND